MARPKTVQGRVKPSTLNLTDDEWISVDAMAEKLFNGNRTALIRTGLGMVRLSGLKSKELRETKAIMKADFFASLPEPQKSIYTLLQQMTLDEIAQLKEAVDEMAKSA